MGLPPICMNCAPATSPDPPVSSGCAKSCCCAPIRYCRPSRLRMCCSARSSCSNSRGTALAFIEFIYLGRNMAAADPPKDPPKADAAAAAPADGEQRVLNQDEIDSLLGFD